MEGRGRTVRVWARVSFWVSGDVRGQQEGAGLHLQQSISTRQQPQCPLCPQCHHTQRWLQTIRAHQGVSAPLCLPLRLFASHTGAAVELRISPLSYKARGPFKNHSRQRDNSALSQRRTRGCFDKRIISTAQVDGGFWRKSRDFLLRLTSPTQTPPFLSKQKCYFPFLTFFFSRRNQDTG